MLPARAPLQSLAFAPLPLGAVRPTGWLLRQLRLQADGLTGHIEEIWPDLGPRSGWLGGPGESWERGPYYLDGLVPLANLLGDEALIARARRWLDYILDHPQPDGWLGPAFDPHEDWHPPHDPWPVAVLFKSLITYHSATGDARVPEAVAVCLRCLLGRLPEHRLLNWARFRWADLLLAVCWLYERTGEGWLLDLAAQLRRQGFDWTPFFSRLRFTQKVEKGAEGYDFRTHGVNVAMGLKAPALAWRLWPDEALRAAPGLGLANLQRWHGQVAGVFGSDGHLAGTAPWQGTELCTVVELMYSLEVLLTVFGETAFADQLERIAYNALPATFTPDMWGHQYDQQANQVLCTVAPRDWTTNWDDSNIFGLEPSYGCCTANCHQGWPKFAAHLWLAAPGGGLAAAAYAPCRVTAPVGDGGATVTIIVDTDYPFDGEVNLTLEAARPVTFPLHLRCPGWAEGGALHLPGGETVALATSGFTRIERAWRPGETRRLHLPMRVSAREMSGGVAVERGPLVYALKIEEDWRQHAGQPPSPEWEVRPKSPWNYALALDPAQPACGAIVTSQPPGPRPFSPEGAPVRLTIPGCRVPEWTLQQNSAGPFPPGPLACREPLESLTLIPYGATTLRVRVFPNLSVPPAP